MGRSDDKEGEVLMSEADEEKDSGNDTSDADEEKDGEKNNSDVDFSDIDSRKKYKCTRPGCSAKFLRPSRLTWHMRKHNDERPYKCDKEGCDRAYTNSSHLKRHLNTTHKLVTKTYECRECGVEVGSLFSLKRHHKKIHNPDRLTCVECGAKFRKKHCYTEHLSMHAGVAMYKCGICNQDFTQMRLLKKHQRVHDSQKTYPCTSTGCTEIFDHWSKLNKHLKTAHEFGHNCDKCDKKFKSKKLLKRHGAVHAREGIVKPCPYDNCPRFYYYPRNLDEHVLIVHLGRRFYCDTCEKSFKYKSTLARHIQVVHEGKKKPASRRKKQRRRNDAGVHKKSMASKLAGIELPRELEVRVLRRSPRIRLGSLDKNPDGVKKIIHQTSSSVDSATLDEKKSSVFLENESRIKTPDAVEESTKESPDTPSCEDERTSLGFVNEVENGSSMAVGDYAEEIVETSGEDDEKGAESALPSGEVMVVEENCDESLKETEEGAESALMSGELMIVEENFDTVVEGNEEELLSALLNDLENEAPSTVVEKYVESSDRKEQTVRTSSRDDLENEAPLKVVEKYDESSDCEKQTMRTSSREDLGNETPLKVAEKYFESSEGAEKTVGSSLIDGHKNDTLGNARPIILAQYGEESLVTSEHTYEKISLWLTTDSVDVTVPLIFKDNFDESSS